MGAREELLENMGLGAHVAKSLVCKERREAKEEALAHPRAEQDHLTLLGQQVAPGKRPSERSPSTGGSGRRAFNQTASSKVARDLERCSSSKQRPYH